MGVPSPCESLRIGDPAFTLTGRSVRVGAPFVSLPRSLSGTHRRERFAGLHAPGLFPCHTCQHVSTVSSLQVCCDG